MTIIAARNLWSVHMTTESAENFEHPSMPATWIVTDTSSHGQDENNEANNSSPTWGAGAALQLQVLRYFVPNEAGATKNGMWAGKLAEQTSNVIAGQF